MLLFLGEQDTITGSNVASPEACCTFFCGGDQSEYYTIGSGDHIYVDNCALA